MAQRRSRSAEEKRGAFSARQAKTKGLREGRKRYNISIIG